MRDDADRRRVLVQITDEAARSTYAMYAPLVEEGQSLFDDLSVPELAVMEGLLERMRKTTDRHADRLRGPA